ncbi:MAG: hypothetical protein A2787_07055 [Omnitrophica WOR_2 bacterium RIFCSPHIGHO2_01_FULL_48_9]|nr:MAG: hypothetical protein A2787_07055 [Omnitrophica WOR_2 bacterium RIFCSPHIGHO2_01_FULL_48_9]
MQVRKYSSRFALVFFSLITFLILFSVKLIFLQIFWSEYLSNLAEKQHNAIVKLEPRRGSILDRNLRPLAFNVTVSSLYANPRLMSEEDKHAATKQLSLLLKMDPAVLRQRLSRNKYFVWIQRKLPEELAGKIKGLKLKGIGFIKESKRFYPNQSLAAHIIGFADIDNRGLEGLELNYDKYLKGEFGWSQILRDARQRELSLERNFMPPKDGFNLVLTIDETIQYLAERALDKAMAKHNAKSASIIVMDPRTGEILALANRPTYNLAEVSSSSIESRTNRAISYMYEPGSVFKIVATAAALEEAAFSETDKINCENGAYRVGNHILHDHHPEGILTFSQVIEQSSNIGVTKIAQRLGPYKFYKYAQSFQFGRKTEIDLDGEVQGVLKHPSDWSKTSIGAIPIGQEVVVTPLQLVSAIAAIANDGIYMRPFVVKYVKDNSEQIIRTFEPKAINQVISPQTAQRTKKILTGVVDNGTGRKAQINGVAVAGKTGTAQKVVGGVYSHNKFYASFIGFAPADNPRLAAVVVFDEPHPSYYGGTVAAPVFQEVISDALKYLEMKE